MDIFIILKNRASKGEFDMTKVSDLTPQSRGVDLKVKIVEKQDEREVTAKATGRQQVRLSGPSYHCEQRRLLLSGSVDYRRH